MCDIEFFLFFLYWTLQVLLACLFIVLSCHVLRAHKVIWYHIWSE